MSLKAKIEAVIYASEEPVTLAQLTGLLGHEAQAELDHLDAAQRTLALEASQQATEEASPSDSAEAPLDQDGLNQEIIVDSESGPQPVEVAVESAIEAAPEAAVEVLEEQGSAPSAESEPAPPAAPDPAASDPAASAPIANKAALDSRAEDPRAEKEKARRLREYFRSILDQLIADYANSGRGIEIREVAGGYRLATKPEYHDAVRGFVKSLKPPLKLSLQALETLAVVAYKQPVTAPEISEIRGVDSGGVLGSLISRKLITTAGRKQVIGRPILYKTTKDFLLRFGLKDINELPSIEEFEKMAGELADNEPVQEEIQMSEHEHHHAPESLNEPERHTHHLQADGSPDPEDNPLDDPIDDSPVPVDESPLDEDSSDVRPAFLKEDPTQTDEQEKPAPEAGDPEHPDHKPKGLEKFIDEIARGEYM
jgi:segregation and condensation protein B